MPNYPADSNDTVVYNGVDLYVPKDCSVTVFEDSRVFLFGEYYLNGLPILTGSGAASGSEVTVGPTQPVDPGISLWFDTSSGYGELKVKIAGNWKTVEDPQDALDANEVSIGTSQPTGAYELWIDTNVVPENLKAKVAGSWKSINSEVAVSGTEPTDPAIELWVDTASPAPTQNTYVSAGNAIGVIAMGTFSPSNPSIAANVLTQITANLNLPMLIGRRYRVYVAIKAANAPAALGMNIFLRDGVTNIPNPNGIWAAVPISSAGLGEMSYEWILDGDGTTKLLNVAVQASGVVQLYNDTQSYFYVEDVGPNVTPAIPLAGTGIEYSLQVTQAQYNALTPPNPRVLYLIVG